MRKKIVAGNWKMNKSYEEGKALAEEVVQLAKAETDSNVTVVVCTPFIHLANVAGFTEGIDNVFIGAQNCSNQASGAYTGEISVSMLESVGVQYVIIGHSERREYFNENNEELAEKTNLALKQGLTPIFCCGESLFTRENEQHFDFVCDQLTESLFHLSEEDFSKVVIAYEPIWAIGTGKTASSAQAQEMHAKIRAHIEKKYGADIANATTILYGGSCKPSNAPELFACPDVDGGLIGGASLNARDFIDITKSY